MNRAPRIMAVGHVVGGSVTHRVVQTMACMAAAAYEPDRPDVMSVLSPTNSLRASDAHVYFKKDGWTVEEIAAEFERKVKEDKAERYEQQGQVFYLKKVKRDWD